MLTPEYLQNVSKELEDYFFDLETAILKDIAERIRLNDNAMTSTASFQLYQLQLLGITNEQVSKRLAKALRISQKEAEKIISNSVYQSLESDNIIFEEAFKQGIIEKFDFKKNKFKDIILEGIVATAGDLTNICNSTAVTAQAKFTQALNNVYLQVSSGAFTMDQAVDMTVSKLASEGLGPIEYKSGVRRQLDTAVRTAVRSSVNKTALKAQEQNLNDFECNLVEVTSHMGARPSHTEWQGKIYWRLHKYKNYSNFEQATQYGKGEGLGGYNCRHSFYPFFEGISEKTFEHYRTKENNELYELQQKQRYNERKIREWKRRRDVKKAAGLNVTKESEKVRYWSKRNDELIKSDDRLKHNYGREKVYLSRKNCIIDISSIKVSGALNPDSKKANKHAERYYESVRKMKTDYINIAQNTGFDVNEVKRIKKYLFIDEHDLLTGKKRFDPDYMIAESWRRMIEGKHIQQHDLTMIKHEILEHQLVLSGLSQDEAHVEASKIHNYDKEAKGYYAKINKRKTK